MDPQTRRNLYVYNGGLLTGRRIRRILDLAGWDVRLGLPGDGDWVGVWGQSPTAPRGETVARAKDAPILRVEDAFLRSVRTGREGDLPLGLCLDDMGVHFDASAPSRIEKILSEDLLDDTALLDLARSMMARIQHFGLSKYNAFDPSLSLPEAPYVLVIDQTVGDASLGDYGTRPGAFAEMLAVAQSEHPGQKIIIKAHPETLAGHRRGHFDESHENDRVSILRDPVSPHLLMQGATAFYTMSSQLGFEAIFAGHKPRVFGQPFYAGWGLTLDENPVARRTRHLSRAQLFAGAMISYPTWYDPHRDTLCSLDCVIDTLHAHARAHHDDAAGYVAHGLRPWKRRHMRAMFGKPAGIRFEATRAKAQRRAAKSGALVMGWGNDPAADVRVEDGFLRSKGLGAALIPPLSLVRDRTGIYYDPTGPSDLEQLIAQSGALPQSERDRARDLIEAIRAHGLSKFNLSMAGQPPAADGRERLLVVGQVEDDASVLLGCGKLRTNAALLKAAREVYPDHSITYKPHPDVEAGLRKGALADRDVLEFADQIAHQTPIHSALDAADRVATLTSTTGFEALLRGLPVTCFGMPFYAGWGLTDDRGDLQVLRRSARPDIVALAHAVLIGYPRYFDPILGTACPPEVVVERLASGAPLPGRPHPIARIGQRIFAGLWHR